MRSRSRGTARASQLRAVLVPALTGLSLVGALVAAGTPTAGAAVEVDVPRPGYVDWDTLQIPEVEGVRFLDRFDRPLTGQVDLPPRDRYGDRLFEIAAEPTSGYTLSEDSDWEWYDGESGRLFHEFSTQQGEDLLTVERDGCDVVLRNDRAFPVAYEIAEYDDYADYGVGEAADGVLQSGASATFTSSMVSTELVAQHPDDYSNPVAGWIDTFECGVGTGEQATRTGVAGCELTLERGRGDAIYLDALFYRGPDGEQSLDGVEFDPEWYGDVPVTLDFSGVGQDDLTVYWTEMVELDAETDDWGVYHGSATVCDGSAPATAPAAPGQPYVRANGTTLTVAWPQVTQDGRSPVSGYVVHQTGPGGSRWIPVDGPLDRVTLRNQAPGAHTFRVYATNRIGNSTASPARAVRVAVPPAAPAQPGSRVSGRDVTIGWNAPRYDGGSPLTGYVVQYGNRYWKVPAATRTITFRNLPRGNHHFRVFASNALGNSAGSPVRTVTLR